jgi:uncharacterized protein YkwD
MFHALMLGLALHGASISVSSEQHMLADLNATRVRAGLPALKLDPRLSDLARRHGLDMANNRYFDHVSKDGKSPFDRMKIDRIAFTYAGENIAQSPDEASAYQALIESPEHLQNIMQRHFSKVGIGAVEGPDGEMLFVQDFTN